MTGTHVSSLGVSVILFPKVGQRQLGALDMQRGTGTGDILFINPLKLCRSNNGMCLVSVRFFFKVTPGIVKFLVTLNTINTVTMALAFIS